MILKILVTLGLAVLFAVMILFDFPVKYLAGFLSLILISLILMQNLFSFLIGLLLLRPGLDYFFSSIRLSVGGVDLGLGGAISLFLVGGAFLHVFILRSDASRRLRLPIVGMYAVFCLIYCAAFLNSYDKPAAAKVLLRLFSICSILILAVVAVKSKATAQGLIRSILFSAVIPLGWGFVNYFLHKGRLAGTFTHANILAFYLLIIMGCLIFQIDNDRPWTKISWKRLCLFGILLVALILTETRSGWAAFLMMTLIYAARFNKRVFIPCIVFMILVSFTPLIQKKIANVFSSYGSKVSINEDSSLGWRFEQWGKLFKPAMERPIFGYGINGDFLLANDGLAAHNDYLRYFVETGLIGLVAAYLPYVYLLIFSLKRFKRRWDFSDPSTKLAAFFVCFIPAFLLMSVTENLNGYIIVHWYLWALIGIFFALNAISGKRDESILDTRKPEAVIPVKNSPALA